MYMRSIFARPRLVEYATRTCGSSSQPWQMRNEDAVVTAFQKSMNGAYYLGFEAIWNRKFEADQGFNGSFPLCIRLGCSARLT